MPLSARWGKQMANWDDTTLSTGETIANIEGEINSLSMSGWDKKIILAKDFLKTRIEIELKRAGYTADPSAGEELIAMLKNPQIFAYASDYLCLYLIYEDLANGKEDTPYGWKMIRYKQNFELKLQQALELADLDLNFDGSVDTYAGGVTSNGYFMR